MGENVFYRVAKEHAQNFVQQNPGAVFPTNAKFCAILMHTHDIVAGFTGISMCNGVVSTVAAEYLAMSEMSKLGHTKALQMVTISLRDFSVSVPETSELSLLSAFDPENYKCAVFVTPYDKVTLGELLGVEDTPEEPAPYEAPAPVYEEPVPQPEPQPVQQPVQQTAAPSAPQSAAPTAVQTAPRRNLSGRSVDEMSVNDILNEVMESNKAAAPSPAPVQEAPKAAAPVIEPVTPVEAPVVEPAAPVEAPKMDAPVMSGTPAVEPASVGEAPVVEPATVDAAPDIEPASVEAAPDVAPATVDAAPELEPAAVEKPAAEKPVPAEESPKAEAAPAPVEEAPAPVEEAPVEEAPAAEEAPELTPEAMSGFDFFSGFGDEEVAEGKAGLPENWEELGFIKSDAPDPEKLAAVAEQHENKSQPNAQTEFARDVNVDESNPFYAEENGEDSKIKYFAEIPEDDPNAETNGGIPVISSVGTHTAEGSAEIISKDDLLKEAKKRKKIAKANFGFRKK